MNLSPKGKFGFFPALMMVFFLIISAGMFASSENNEITKAVFYVA